MALPFRFRIKLSLAVDSAFLSLLGARGGLGDNHSPHLRPWLLPGETPTLGKGRPPRPQA